MIDTKLADAEKAQEIHGRLQSGFLSMGRDVRTFAYQDVEDAMNVIPGLVIGVRELVEENLKLREALEPFANVMMPFGGIGSDSHTITVRIDSVRRAAEALKGGEK